MLTMITHGNKTSIALHIKLMNDLNDKLMPINFVLKNKYDLLATDRNPKQDPVLGRIEQDPVRPGNKFMFWSLV